MKVKSARTALLSDFEVLSLMREMDKKQQHQEKTDAEQNPERAMQFLPPNLRTIQYSVLETLSNVQRPCAHQTKASIPKFMDSLLAWERGFAVEGLDDDVADVKKPVRTPIEKERRLTKGERLVLVNLVPTTEVELYTMIEELPERFNEEERSNLLQLIWYHLPLDQQAIQDEENRALAAATTEANGQVFVDDNGQDVYVSQADGEEEAGYDEVHPDDEDLEMLENEGRGEGAVDDEQGDE